MRKARKKPRTEAEARQDLDFTCDRRAFFRVLFQEAAVFRGSVKGRGSGARLSELGSLPDEHLAQIRPVINPDSEVFTQEASVWSRSKKMGTVIQLFPTTRENMIVFDMFDGEHTLAEIAGRLAQEMGWDPAAAFAHTRELFLSLVQHVVCIPRDPPQSQR